MTRRSKNSEPVFVRQQEPILTPRPGAWHWRVPYPYQFKMDGGWILVLLLAGMGLVWHVWLIPAAFIAVLRVWIWCAFRFPMTTAFFNALIWGLIGGRRRWRSVAQCWKQRHPILLLQANDLGILAERLQ
jgi:hypothetical protein